MRGLTSTIILAVVLAALVGYIYFADPKSSDTAAETKEKAFARVEADAIEELRIKAAGGETSHLRKGAGGWGIVEPTKAEADASELSSVTSNLSSLEVQRVVEENPANLAQYGLDPPRVDVAFRLKNEKDFRHLLMGDKTPTGGDLYAKLQTDKKVFLVSSFLENTFNRTPFDLRDKSVLEFDREKAELVDLVNGPTTIQFAKSGTDWKIVKPVAARGDFGAIEGIVTRLSSGQMQRIVDPEPKDLKAYGLDKPVATVSVSAGSARASIMLGKDEGESTFAKDTSRPMVFAVEKSFVTDLKKELGEFRRKDLFDFRSFNANRIEIRRGADTYAFQKTKDKDGKEIWRNAAGKDADTTKVEDMLTKFSNLRAQSFEAGQHASLKTPDVTVTVRFDDSKTETATFGRAGSDIYASRADEPGSAKLDTTPYDDALKALDALK